MANRLDLQKIFENIMGSRNVYFQPPETKKLTYPCIIYNLSDIVSKPADDIKYQTMKRYTVTLIDKNPDSQYVDGILSLPYCSFDRAFVTDNLNHFTYTIYY